jgi:hypothetical protein
MIPLDGSRDPADAVPATLLPLVFDPDTGRMFWLDAQGQMISSPVTSIGLASSAVTTPTARAGADRRLVDVRALLDDIATYTGRPLSLSVALPNVDGSDEYTVVWFNHDYDAATPREAAEHSWQWMRCSDSQACVFQVVNRRTGERVQVDLLDDEAGTEADRGSAS